jgi:hypothetical protein
VNCNYCSSSACKPFPLAIHPLPFAFHCTGMPIKASANKLAREIQQSFSDVSYGFSNSQIIAPN